MHACNLYNNYPKQLPILHLGREMQLRIKRLAQTRMRNTLTLTGPRSTPQLSEREARAVPLDHRASM